LQETCLVQKKTDVHNNRSVSNGVDIIGTLQRFAKNSLFFLSFVNLKARRGKRRGEGKLKNQIECKNV